MKNKIIAMAGMLLLLMSGRPTFVSVSELLFPGEAASQGYPYGAYPVWPGDSMDYGELKRMNDLKEKEMEIRRKEKEAQEELRKERELQAYNKKKRAERIKKVESVRGKKCTSWQLLNR